METLSDQSNKANRQALFSSRSWPYQSTRTSRGCSGNRRLCGCKNYKSYAIGHGTATDWPSKTSNGGVAEVWTDVMPVFEMPTTTPDLKMPGADPGTEALKISMRKLSGIDGSEDQFSELFMLADLYDGWIKRLHDRMAEDTELKGANVCEPILDRIQVARDRLQVGLNLVSDSDAANVRKSF